MKKLLVPENEKTRRAILIDLLYSTREELETLSTNQLETLCLKRGRIKEAKK